MTRALDSAMDEIPDHQAISEPISAARCRELLGDEARHLSDDEIEAIRRHAHAMAHVLVDVFLTDEPRT